MAEEEEILFVGFNQDATSLAVGTHRGYSLFSLKAAADILEKEHDSTEVEDTCLIDRLFLSSLITVVSLNAPRKLRVFHFQKQTEICSHSYSNTILAVKLNRLRVVVCLEESLYIHNIRDMKVLHTIRDTPANSQGLCQLASSDISYLAYPGSSHTGEVHVFDAANLQLVATIIAHDSPLAAIKFNADGSKLATASQKGTVIRVFSVPQGDRLFEFRRGMKRCVSISCLNFSADSLFLCASSNTETVHVFKLDQHSDAQQQRTPSETPSSSQQQPAAQAGWMDFVKGTAVTYLPTHMTDILQQDRAFATAKLPSISAKNTVALAMIGKVLRLLVASTDGYVYIYDVDRVHGGECSLVKQHKFTGSIGAAGSSPGGGSSYATAVRPQDGNTPIEEKIETAAGAVGSGHIDDYDEDFPPMSHNAD